MKRWAKRIAITLVSLLGLAILFGAGAEAVMRARVARQYPAAGRLVDIGGRRIQIDCRGSGSPTVVLESGLDTFGSLSWVAVHDSIAKTSRTCAYSRAGIMWSDAVSGALDTKGVAQDLHEALTKAGEPGPFVVVGHSLGGPYALIFTDLYPADVAGLVFVDASHPDQVERLQRAAGTQVKDPTGMLTVLASLAWTGIGRLLPAGGSPKIPAATRAAMGAYAPTSLAPAVRELKSLNATLEAAGKHRRNRDEQQAKASRGRAHGHEDLLPRDLHGRDTLAGAKALPFGHLRIRLEADATELLLGLVQDEGTVCEDLVPRLVIHQLR